ncbi:MAG: SAM-dependent methyltransferase [Pseudoalteromonas sp.]|uniref:N-6 DNA methylase n=1 Tax=Pseudoalteromonas sp. TaxID=53249 RepID=UPI000C933E4F|nr:N-6 DNA methylase [Pseudoalteromonas sp.]MAD04560.1 SAM-dependent methyltransferase [Pseudoalteromonas sp.]|tara:strand:+ start:22733 stop:24364 length:1632 start_codon:yes stop_codon:yes gene_type:complete
MKFKADQTAQKLRGGYYTPQNLADYVTKWVLASKPESIIEPSCGDGSFLTALNNNNANKDLRINAFELFDTEAEKSRKKCAEFGFENANVTEGDFLSWANNNLNSVEQQVSGILGNPPFIRYQFLEKEFQTQTELVFKQLNLKFTKHTNAWVPFILACIKLLKSGGRLGMVIPSEIIHVMHAQSLRTFLGEQCSKLVVIDPQEIWFENTLQGAVILLAQKKNEITDHAYGVGIKHVKGFEFLNENPETLFNDTNAINGQTVIGKWTKALLSPTELELVTRTMRKSNVYKFTEVADVDVGIVTGANKFFLVDNETVEKFGLQEFSHPMFGKSQHCKGIIYNRKQHTHNEENKYPTNFIYLENDFSDLPESVQEYIKLGESEELHKRYKCRIRKPWYKVPSVYSRNLGMLKRSHDTPRLIFNEIEALTTDTAYRVTAKGMNAAKLAYCFINPLTAIFAELEGRYYGGGVLELVPSEIEKLHIPVPDNLDFNIEELDEIIRTTDMTEILRMQGYKILAPLGLNHEEIDNLVAIWERLKNRRQRKDH